MRTYSVNLKKLQSFRYWQNFYLSIYIIALSGLFFLLIYSHMVKSGSMRLNPDLGIKAKIFVWTFSILILLLLSLFILIMVRFNKFINNSIRKSGDMKVKIDETLLYISANGISYSLMLDQVILNNYIIQGSIQSPFFGQGVLVVIDSQKQKFVIPSIVFDESVGAYTVRDIFKHRANYHQIKAKWHVTPKQI